MHFFGFLTVVVLGLVALGIVSIILRFMSKDPAQVVDPDEMRGLQQLAKTLDRLERRIEVLETLLADHPSSTKLNN